MRYQSFFNPKFWLSNSWFSDFMQYGVQFVFSTTVVNKGVIIGILDFEEGSFSENLWRNTRGRKGIFEFRSLENFFHMAKNGCFQFYLVKMDVFLRRAFNGKVPPVLLLPDGFLPVPVHPQAKEAVALSRWSSGGTWKMVLKCPNSSYT